MDAGYLPEFEGAYLEDSYFLGLVAEGGNLRLKLLFALTADHADYVLPNPGEQHCYRHGSIVIEKASIIEWQPGKPTITRDLDGSFDLGSIELYRNGPGRFRFVTEWFDATLKAEQLRLELSDANT
jgi:hypothetical protein